MVKPRILVVADEAALRATLARWLLGAGYAVELAEGAKRAREVLAAEPITLIILEADRHGAPSDLARELANSSARVIAIIEGVVEGSAAIPASGYLRRPLSEPDVLARVESVLQGPSKPDLQPGPEPLRFEGYTLDVVGRACIDPRGAEVVLTRAEFSLLLVMAQQPGRALSRDELRQAILGRDAEPDDRSVDMLISRLRRKIEPDPKAPRMIVTVPGVGYKFGVRSQPASPPAEITPAVVAASPAVVAPIAHLQTDESSRQRAHPAASSPAFLPPALRRIVFFGIVGAVAIAGLLLIPGKTPQPAGTLVSKFNANAIPLVFDTTRAQLSSYEHEPDAKAIAISREGWGLSLGAADEEAAKNEALDRCRDRDKGGFCRIYAVGDKVVWPKSALPVPLPADLRTDGPMSLVASDDLVKLWQMVWHVSPPKVVMDYEGRTNHKAIAVALPGVTVTDGRSTQAEAVRLVIERCSEYANAPCLLLSADGLWRVNVPRFHRITGPFTLAGEREMSEAERQRVAQIYAGKDWRALVKGGSGHWYAISEQDGELTAAEAVLRTCREAEQECVLHAIGNWRVGEKLAGGG